MFYFQKLTHIILRNIYDDVFVMRSVLQFEANVHEQQLLLLPSPKTERELAVSFPTPFAIRMLVTRGSQRSSDWEKRRCRLWEELFTSKVLRLERRLRSPNDDFGSKLAGVAPKGSQEEASQLLIVKTLNSQNKRLFKNLKTWESNFYIRLCRIEILWFLWIRSKWSDREIEQ